MKSGLRGAIVVVAICAWFAISNHCVFAALATNSTRVPVSFQTKGKTVYRCAVLQSFARSCFGSGKELGSR